MSPADLAGAAPPVPFRDALRVWLRIGFIGFGGPAGQIALMHRILVDEKKWISETRFLHALNYCMVLPGPEAQQLATYVGWLLHRTAGGLAAGLLFILPGFLLMLGIAVVYALYGQLGWMQGLLFGLQAATLAIVAGAVLRVGRKALRHRAHWVIAGLAFAAIFLFGAPFPLIILAAALAGWLGSRIRPDIFLPPPVAAAETDPHAVDRHAAPTASRTAATLGLGLLLWFAPVGLVVALAGAGDVLAQESFFFSKMAVVTFGGAYAVLAYMGQQAVERYGWLAADEMIQGLALAETTPGPLILVLTWVGFLGAFRDPGSLSPLAAGVLGAVISTWVTFVPCFLWIFLGAPYVEKLRGKRALDAALTGITAAVVGVILNLSLWFALHVLFGRVERVEAGLLRLSLPDPASLDPWALALAAAAMLALLRWRLGLLKVLGACALAGLFIHLRLK